MNSSEVGSAVNLRVAKPARTKDAVAVPGARERAASLARPRVSQSATHVLFAPNRWRVRVSAQSHGRITDDRPEGPRPARSGVPPLPDRGWSNPRRGPLRPRDRVAL